MWSQERLGKLEAAEGMVASLWQRGPADLSDLLHFQSVFNHFSTLFHHFASIFWSVMSGGGPRHLETLAQAHQRQHDEPRVKRPADLMRSLEKMGATSCLMPNDKALGRLRPVTGQPTSAARSWRDVP